MAGYSGQLVALNTNTPSETELSAAQADAYSTAAKVAKASAPYDIALKQQAAATGALNLADQVKLKTLKDDAVAKLLAQQTQQPSQLATPNQQAAPAPMPTLFDPRVQEVMQSINPDDPNAAQKWDAGMEAISGEVPQAKQFVGNYSKNMLMNPNGWLAQAGTHAVSSPLQGARPQGVMPQAASPLAAPQQGAAQTASPLASLGGPATPSAQAVSPQQQAQQLAISPATGKVDPAMVEMAIRFPAQAKEIQSMEGMLVYQQTGDPNVLKRWAPDLYAKLAEADKAFTAAQKERVEMVSDFIGRRALAVRTLGEDAKAAGRDPNTDPAVRAAYDTSIREAASQGFMQPQEATQRISSPIDWAWVTKTQIEADTVAQHLQNSAQNRGAIAGAEAAAKAPYEQHYTPAGTDAQGNLITIDTKTGGVKNTGVAIQGKAEQYYQVKHDSWLAAHPGDEAGAVAFAGGKKDVSPTQIAAIAQANTIKQQSTAQMMGQPFDYGTAYANNLKQLQQASPAAPSAATPTAAAGTPSKFGHTPAVNQAAQAFISQGVLPVLTDHGVAQQQVKYDPNAPHGSLANPHFPVDQKAYDRLPKGTHFMGKDGVVRTKL